MAMPQESRPASQVRWHGAAQLMGVMRAEPGITRAAAAQRLGIGTGGAADLVARLRRSHLLDEKPAPAQGRGRPTTVLGAHPDGPLVLAAELRAGDWRLVRAGVDGATQLLAEGDHRRLGSARVISEIGSAITEACRNGDGRVRAVGMSVAGTVSDTRLVQFTTKGWRDTELSGLTAELPGVPLLLGNDATLAGLAEARSGAARDAGTVLHLIIAVGLGGTLVVNGEPVTGAQGAAGEYGHVPFGDPTLECPCGATGCWDQHVDGRALARHRGEPEPTDPVGYARELLDRQPDDPKSRTAFDAVAAALGRGIGGLVNLHDPDVVTLGGLAPPLRAAAPNAFDTAYRNGLMAFRKTSAPPIRDGVHGDDAPLAGAVALALDHVTSEAALADWSRRRVDS